ETSKKEKKKSKKRKLDETADSAEPERKRAHVQPQPSTNSSIAAASRAVKDGLKGEEEKRKKGMSDAVKSLYGPSKGREDRKETFMTRG
ncbi:hypothetical protein OFN10_29090, partial [Escherichia coli]|nr:hypothetical protein [Escherichia coli]